MCLVSLVAASRAQEPDYRDLCQELKESGFKIVYSGIAYEVPFVEIEIPEGFSITRFCRRIPTFEREFNHSRNRIAFFNALHPSYIKTRTREPFSIETDTLKVPLDIHKVPEIFPAYDKALVRHDKYLLVDIGKGFLALYVKGELKRVFPVSAGVAGKKTPLLTFEVQAKYQNHWSTIYESWMPWALLLQRPYYIHGGVLPGLHDSAGCVRLFTHHAQELYNLVDVGTPGRIIHTPKLDRGYPAPFCR
ncbi:MAG: L,D-transpeptidase [Desulfobacteraceae bacterium]